MNTKHWESLSCEAKLELMQKARDTLRTKSVKIQEKLDGLLDAIGALTNAENRLSCIPEGPERDELQRLYDAERLDDEDGNIDMPFSGSMERRD